MPPQQRSAKYSIKIANLFPFPETAPIEEQAGGSLYTDEHKASTIKNKAIKMLGDSAIETRLKLYAHDFPPYKQKTSSGSKKIKKQHYKKAKKPVKHNLTQPFYPGRDPRRDLSYLFQRGYKYYEKFIEDCLREMKNSICIKLKGKNLLDEIYLELLLTILKSFSDSNQARSYPLQKFNQCIVTWKLNEATFVEASLLYVLLYAYNPSYVFLPDQEKYILQDPVEKTILEVQKRLNELFEM